MARHPSKIRWDVENKERLAELKANWYKENKQRLKEKRLLCIEEQREKWRANTHNKRARKRANGGVITPGIDKKLFSLQRQTRRRCEVITFSIQLNLCNQEGFCCKRIATYPLWPLS